jgi:hypothetical protein
MMKTATCLHIVDVYDNTNERVLFPGVIRGVLLGLTVLVILEPSLCEVVLFSSCRNRHFCLYTSADVLLIKNKLFIMKYLVYCKLGLFVSRVTIQKKAWRHVISPSGELSKFPWENFLHDLTTDFATLFGRRHRLKIYAYYLKTVNHVLPSRNCHRQSLQDLASPNNRHNALNSRTHK